MIVNSASAEAAPRIDLAETTDFDLGGLRVSPARREVRINGERRELEPRVAKVLVALASARPGVVSRDRLLEQCWDGRLVGDDAINRCIVALRQLAREFSPEPFAIETVSRVGYSLVERAVEEPVTAPRSPKREKMIAIACLIAVLFAAALAVAWFRTEPAGEAPASVAVLPFRNLSGGTPYFGDGIAEEVLVQLSREPHFRIAGRASSSEFREQPDIREVARRLDVDYVVQGSVRTHENRVRVSANLVRAADGIQLWSNIYDGNLDDIFAIQQRIGGSIASALKHTLVRTPVLSGPLITNGEAYNLHLTARGLIRTYNRRVGATAAALYRDAIDVDPGYAPAWAGLAAATQLQGAMNGYEGLIAAVPQARAYARHSLRLAPDFAEGHRTLGLLLGYGTREAQAHLRRAAALEPQNAENMIWLGIAHGAAGEFDQERAAYDRAVQLDPLWFRTIGHLALAHAEMGDRRQAETIAQRKFANNDISRNLLLGRIAWIFGDFSQAAERWSTVARSNSPRWSDTARRSVNDAAFAVGVNTGPLIAVPPPNDQRRLTPVWLEAPPQPSAWKARNRNTIAAEIYRDHNHKAAKLMLNAGRADELVSTYDSTAGLFGVRAGQALRADQLHEAPLVALALRQAGRRAEADELLRKAADRLRRVYAASRVPFWFDADGAAIWAALGRREQALSMLARAVARGWTHSANTDLRDIADEPAFRELRGHQRFQQIRSRLAAQREREAREIRRSHLVAAPSA